MIIITLVLIGGCNIGPLGLTPNDNEITDVTIRLVPPPGRSVIHPGSCSGEPFRTLMENPDEWIITRKIIDYLGYYCWILNDRFTDNELAHYFDFLGSSNIPLSLEVAVVKNLSGFHTGEECFAIESPRWSRFLSLGANIRELTLDEPLTGTVSGGLGGIDYAVTETADWLELTREYFTQHGQDISICMIEAYPYNSKNKLVKFLQLLKTECETRNIEGIDAFALDYDWDCGGSWEEVVSLEGCVHRLGLEFCLIYWPAAHPGSHCHDYGFYVDIMSQGAAYQAAGGSPDIYTIQSWDYIPRPALCPDNLTGHSQSLFLSSQHEKTKPDQAGAFATRKH